MKSVFNKLAVSAMFAAAIFTAVPVVQAEEDDAIAKAIKARRAGMMQHLQARWQIIWSVSPV